MRVVFLIFLQDEYTVNKTLMEIEKQIDQTLNRITFPSHVERMAVMKRDLETSPITSYWYTPTRDGLFLTLKCSRCSRLTISTM